VHEDVNGEIRALSEHWDFCAKNIVESCDFFIGFLGIHMNLRLVVLILTSHPLISLIMSLLTKKFVIVLIMIAILVPIIFLMMVLLGLVL